MNLAQTHEPRDNPGQYEKLKKEFEDFSYIVSHDLQGPLRSIASFSELLCERYHDQLDERARDYFRYVTNGTTQMQDMIDALLAYSRIDSRKSPYTLTSLEDLLRKAWQPHEHRDVILHRPSDMPLVFCDAQQMTQAFAAILDNAVKFQPTGGRAEIWIETRQEDNQRIISFRDNGIGIRTDMCESIFHVFRRLNPPGTYPGLGMGLALVKKIAERHGGTAEAESIPGAGLTIRITFPENRHAEHSS